MDILDQLDVKSDGKQRFLVSWMHDLSRFCCKNRNFLSKNRKFNEGNHDFGGNLGSFVDKNENGSHTRICEKKSTF